MPDGFENALRLLPEMLQSAARGLAPSEQERAEEFRLRAGRPPTVLAGDTEQILGGAPVTETTLRAVLDAATESSFHAAADELRRGFVTARGGVRVGVCGTAATDGTSIRALREISSLSVRIPRQVPDAGREVIGALGDADVLVLSPPGGGKTTFLRELVRTVSDAGVRVGLADERGEIAAVCGGVPQFDVGRCTDVLSGAPKAEAATLLLRAMNPRVIALDEISDPADAEAVYRVAGCGVRVFATAHAAGPAQLRQKRPVYREMLDAGIFRTAVVISAHAGRRTYEAVAL